MSDQSKTSPEHTIKVALDTAAAATHAEREAKNKAPAGKGGTRAEKRRAETAAAVSLPDDSSSSR
jgi:hypothetical protein